jgi:hypothetical protein
VRVFERRKTSDTHSHGYTLVLRVIASIAFCGFGVMAYIDIKDGKVSQGLKEIVGQALIALLGLLTRSQGQAAEHPMKAEVNAEKGTATVESGEQNERVDRGS